MSLRRAVKALGFKDFIKMGFAVATAKKVAVSSLPKNETQRRNKVKEVGVIGCDLSQQFEIFPEMVKMITGVNIAMINILDGKNQFTIGGSGVPIDPLLAMPQKMSFCQYALLSPEPLIIPDLSVDKRFAGSHFTKPPTNAAFYAGFPLNTPEGLVLGTLCAIHQRPHSIDGEQQRLMKQLAKAVTDQILMRNEQAKLTASQVASILGKFVRFAPKGTINELIGFLDFCALGTASAETLRSLERDGIVVSSGGEVTLTQDGSDLKNELRLAGGGYLSHQSKTPSVGNELDDLLSKLG